MKPHYFYSKQPRCLIIHLVVYNSNEKEMNISFINEPFTNLAIKSAIVNHLKIFKQLSTYFSHIKCTPLYFRSDFIHLN